MYWFKICWWAGTFVSCPLELAGFLLSVPGSPSAVTVTSDHLCQVVDGFIFCSSFLVRALVLQGWGEREQSRLKSYTRLEGTEILFSISEYCHAVGGFKTPECGILSLLTGAVPLEALIGLEASHWTTERGKESYCSAQWWGNRGFAPQASECWVGLQVKSALRQVSTFAARLQSACHTLSLSVINIKLFHAKCILSDMDVLRLASQSVLQLTGVGVLWKEGGVIFMSVWGWGRLDLALLHPSDCLGSLFVFCLLWKGPSFPPDSRKALRAVNPKWDASNSWQLSRTFPFRSVPCSV